MDEEHIVRVWGPLIPRSYTEEVERCGGVFLDLEPEVFTVKFQNLDGARDLFKILHDCNFKFVEYVCRFEHTWDIWDTYISYLPKLNSYNYLVIYDRQIMIPLADFPRLLCQY